jgi:hypothetical protein
LLLTVIVPLELIVTVQVAVIVPLNSTFPVVAACPVWQVQAASKLAAMAARKNFIGTPLSSRTMRLNVGVIFPLSWLI